MSNALSIAEDTNNRYVIYPIKHHEVWEMYKKAEANFWTTEELDLSKDLKDFNQLNDGEKYFIENVLAFFAAVALEVKLHISGIEGRAIMERHAGFELETVGEPVFRDGPAFGQHRPDLAGAIDAGQALIDVISRDLRNRRGRGRSRVETG